MASSVLGNDVMQEFVERLGEIGDGSYRTHG